jgi:hypothetical protein
VRGPSEQTQTITQAQLLAVMTRWVRAYREGHTRSFEEFEALPAEQIAAESAEYLWRELASMEVAS